jgi:hypothetical protein
MVSNEKICREAEVGKRVEGLLELDARMIVLLNKNLD